MSIVHCPYKTVPRRPCWLWLKKLYSLRLADSQHLRMKLEVGRLEMVLWSVLLLLVLASGQEVGNWPSHHSQNHIYLIPPPSNHPVTEVTVEEAEDNYEYIDYDYSDYYYYQQVNFKENIVKLFFAERGGLWKCVPPIAQLHVRCAGLPWPKLCLQLEDQGALGQVWVQQVQLCRGQPPVCLWFHLPIPGRPMRYKQVVSLIDGLPSQMRRKSQHCHSLEGAEVWPVSISFLWSFLNSVNARILGMSNWTAHPLIIVQGF